MRKQSVIAISGVLLCLCLCSTLAAQSNYSGTWVLDKGSQKIVPKNMVNYTVVIKQDEDKVTVVTAPNGTVDTDAQGSGNNSVFQNLSPQTQAPKVGGGGRQVSSTGTMGEETPGSNVPGSMALQMVFTQANYTLDGKKAVAFVPGFGDAQFLGKWSKGGKSLELTITQDDAHFSSKEQWTLSADGQTLKLHRAVSTQTTSDNIVLVFRKKSAP